MHPQLADLPGRWRRSLLTLPDGSTDRTTRVEWLQGLTTFVDLRQPAALPKFRRASSLEELTMADCMALATQSGFAGRLCFDGQHFEWHRQIDFQPVAAMADAGSLSWSDGALVERGRDADYVEHWHRDPSAALEPVAAITWRQPERDTTAMLLRVGEEFMFARDRSSPLPAFETLQHCVTAADSLKAARQMVDCEISAGRITSSGFQIERSTLPFQCGRRLHLTSLASWKVLATEGDIAVLHIVD